MLQVPSIYEALVTSLRSNCDGVPSHAGTHAEGLAATANLVFAVEGQDTLGVATVVAGTQTYEGSVIGSRTALWEGLEVRGNAVGVRLETSGLVPGFQAFVVYSNYVTRATEIGEVGANDGYQIGSSIDDLAEGQALEEPKDVLVMSLTAALERESELISYIPAVASADFYLNGTYPEIVAGDWVVAESGTLRSAVRVKQASHRQRAIAPGDNQPTRAVTFLVLEPSPFGANDIEVDSVRIWFNARKAGTLERIPTKTVNKSHFDIPRLVTLPPDTLLPVQDTFIVIQDAEGTTLRAKGGGQLDDDDNPQIMITEFLEKFDGELVKPITFIWGLTKVTRGETVHREVIGSGDAMQRWQSFRLAKSPLTYVADPFAPGGRRAEIEVFVNGLKWRRAQSFYKAGPKDEIYVIRHDADHQTFVQFGDGELGKRLPTGSKNVVATYRHGVGGNVEANTITQLVRPIKGVTEVNNPLPATGGEDPPTEAEAREKAIQSTRVLGRLVSVVDFEVEAARYGGVIRAKALWGWDKAADDAVVKVWIICADDGEPSPDLRTYLTKMAEPEVRVEVYKATKYARELTINLELDPNYLPEEVNAAVDARLFDEFDGLLAPRNVPIGGVFHRSELYAAIHEIAGVLSVQSLFVDSDPMPKRITLAEGEYLALTSPEAV